MYYINHINRSILQITGKDKFSFLQGLITNDVNLVKHNPMIYTAMLNANGRFFCDFFLRYDPKQDCILLDTDTDAVDIITTKLNLYKINTDVIIQNVSKDYDVISIHDCDTNCPSASDDPRTAKMGKRIINHKNVTSNTVQNITAKKITYYDNSRILHCVPKYNKELLPGKTIPLEANLEEMNAISFDKGCYLGQELTSRTKHQGIVRKKLYTVKITGPVPEGKTIFLKQNKIGMLFSYNNEYGIAKLRIEEADHCLANHHLLQLANSTNILIHDNT